MVHMPISLDRLRQQLSELNFFNEDAITQIEKANLLIRKSIISIEAQIDQFDFASPDEEIHFFRHIKPQLYSLQIAFNKLLKIELLRPAYSKKEFKIILKQKLDFIKAHYIDFPEFTRYYNGTSTHDDTRYFLRSNRIELSCFPLLYDDRHSTGYDVVAAYMLAYKFLINHFEGNSPIIQSNSNNLKLSWSADKVAFVELFSGLKAIGAINEGNIGLKTLCVQLGQVLNIDVKDIYKKRGEIKERKGERFRFLRQMIDKLEKDFDEDYY